MTEFWDEAFKSKQEMWGSEPTNTALVCAKMFADKKVEKVLVPGIGYGRNAAPFLNRGMSVTGIEISETAIRLAEKNFGNTLTIHHASVTDMPVDQDLYDGIFCHGLIHLLDKKDRAKLISDCYDQLADGGTMVFTAISKAASTYGQGTLIEKDRYQQFGGVNMFFYDLDSIEREFGKYGLHFIETVEDNYPFHLIECRK